MYVVQAHSEVQRYTCQSIDGGKKLSGLFVMWTTIFQNQYKQVTLPFLPNSLCLFSQITVPENIKFRYSPSKIQQWDRNAKTLTDYDDTCAFLFQNMLLSSVAMICLILAISRTCFQNKKKQFPKRQPNKWLNMGTPKLSKVLWSQNAVMQNPTVACLLSGTDYWPASFLSRWP